MEQDSLRLRLTIRRNGLPEARIVFLLPLNDDATVFKLLEHVNETIPLETADWGLDDYAVEVKSPSGTAFECLHFQPIVTLWEKDEEILIRPLSSEDLKKRRISGRHQISSDGRHLVDGVPFGRPKLKRPIRRPPVHIQPRKRRRLLYDYGDDENDLSEIPQELRLLTEHEYVDADSGGEDEGADGEYDSKGESSGESEALDGDDPDFRLEDDELQLLREDAFGRQNNPASPPQLAAGDDATAEESSGSSSDEFIPSEDQNSGSDEDATSESESGGGGSGGGGQASSDDNESSSSEDSSSEDSSDEDSSDEDSSEDDATDNAGDKKKVTLTSKNGQVSNNNADVSMPDVHGTTPSGLEARKRSESFSSCIDYYVTANSASEDDLGPEEEPIQHSVTGITEAAAPPKTRTQKRNARRRAKRAILKAHAEAGLNVEAKTAAAESVPQQMDLDGDASVVDASAVGSSPLSPSLTSQKTMEERRRLKLDIGAGRRLLFNALGLRNPSAIFNDKKTQEPTGSSHSAPTTNSTTETLPVSSDHGINESSETCPPKHWSSKINYSAVECLNSDLVLTDPPFPFVQQWNKQKKGKRPSSRNSTPHETGNDAGSTGVEDGQHVKKMKRKDTQNLNETSNEDANSAASQQIAVDNLADTPDLPSLPTDISSLPSLEPGQACAGTVITWKKWALSRKTNWQPQVVDVTARVTEVRDDGTELEVLLARRDREFDAVEKLYDEETGERVYDRFEVPDMEDTEDKGSGAEADGGAGADDGIRVLSFSDLLSPRIVQSAKMAN